MAMQGPSIYYGAVSRNFEVGFFSIAVRIAYSFSNKSNVIVFFIFNECGVNPEFGRINLIVDNPACKLEGHSMQLNFYPVLRPHPVLEYFKLQLTDYAEYRLVKVASRWNT